MQAKNKQTGFTLIELIVVIVILGILAATALPKFIDLSGDAGDSSAQGVAGALSSATALNYSKYQLSAGAATALGSAQTCAALTPLLAGGALPDNITYVASTNTLTGCTKSGDVDKTRCMVKHSKGTTTAGFAVSVVCTGA